MPVKIEHKINATCDACNRSFGEFVGDQIAMIAEAKKNGWWITATGKTVCEKCLAIQHKVDAITEEDLNAYKPADQSAQQQPKKDEGKSEKPQTDKPLAERIQDDVDNLAKAKKSK